MEREGWKEGAIGQKTSIKVITKKDLIQFEEEIKALFLDGQIKTPIHLATGSEERLVEIFKDIKPNDWVFSTYRSHYHALLKGMSPQWVKQEILKGRSMHLNSREHKFFTSSIVGGCLPIATGVAMAIQRQGLADWVWVFTGDMAAETGVFHECYKYSARHNLPITFVIEDNGLSVNTPTKETWGFPAAPAEGRNFMGRIRFTYERTYPHQGAGQWVDFK